MERSRRRQAGARGVADEPLIRDVSHNADEDLTREPEMVKAYRDTWELGLHSYLTYMRDRLLLARDLLATSGSVFVQISDENLHHVRELMDEVFGAGNKLAQVSFLRGGTQTVGKGLPANADFLLWYARDVERSKVRPVLLADGGWAARSQDLWVELRACAALSGRSNTSAGHHRYPQCESRGEHRRGSSDHCILKTELEGRPP